MESRERFEISELDRRLSNVIRVGTVIAVSAAKGRAQISDGHWSSAWLPWLEARAGAAATWTPPQVGEQAVALCPAGEPDAGVIVAGLFNTRNPPPGDRLKLSTRRFSDGAHETHDADSGVWTFSVPSGAIILEAGGVSLTVTPTGVVIDGDVTITGSASVAGGVSITGGAAIKGNAAIAGGVSVSGSADIAGDAEILGDAAIKGGSEIEGDLKVKGSTDLSDTTINGISQRRD